MLKKKTSGRKKASIKTKGYQLGKKLEMRKSKAVRGGMVFRKIG